MSSTVNRKTPSDPLRLVLCDAGGMGEEDGVLKVAWDSVSPPPGWHSIPAMAEQRAIAIRAEYFSWLNGLARHDVGGRSLRDRLRWNDYGLSFWDMSLIAEKSPMKSGDIYTVFKLRALELFYLESGCVGIDYRGGDRRLAGILGGWMLGLKHPFCFFPMGLFPGIKRRLPRIVRALGHLGQRLWHEVRRAPGAPDAIVSGPDGQLPLNVFTYVPNMDLAAAAKGQFRSRYWEGLHDVFAATGRPVNWIWIFSGTGDMSYAQAVEYARGFNATGANRHILLEQFVSFRVVARTLFRYLRLLIAGMSMRPPVEAFHLPGSSMVFFPVLESLWHDSLTGSSAMANAWHSCIYENVAGCLPKAAVTLYLWENQPWELAMLTSMREQEQGPILGHQHALPAPLNLRYIPLPDTPLPDRLVVGGPGPRRIILEGGVAPDRVVMCEAARYQYLAGLSNRVVPDGNLLVITSLLVDETREQLALLAASFRQGGLGQFRRITIKPHPFLAVEPILDSLGVRAAFNITSQPLGDLWPSTSAAFVANATAASFDALYAGVPFVICSAGDAMNLNPLFMQPGVEIVATPEALEHSLKLALRPALDRRYLLLDPTLARWRALLVDPGAPHRPD